MLRTPLPPRVEAIFPLAIAGITASAIYGLRLSSLCNVVGFSLCLFVAALLSKNSLKHIHLMSAGRKVAAALSIIFLIMLLVTPNVRGAGITEYNLPPGSAKPYGLATNGTHVWAAEFGSDKLVAMRQDPGNPFIYEFKLPDGSRPYDLVWGGGPAQTVWFTESSAHKIGVLYEDVPPGPGGYKLIEYTISVDRQPLGIAIQHNSTTPQWPTIWFTESKGVIGAVLYASGWKLQEWFLPDENCGPLSIIHLGSTGVWFTEYESHRIGNLYFDPGKNEYRLKEWPLKPSSFPWSLANDTFGNVWFTESGRNRIGRLNPYTNEITEFLIPTPNSQPYGIVVDGYNNVWFAEHATNKIGRFSAGPNIFVEFSRNVAGSPFEVLWEPGTDAGTVDIWFTDEGGNRIGNLDSSKATTSMTVSTITPIITESSTATTLGTSKATKTVGPDPNSPGAGAFVSSSATTTSTTRYSASETSRILVTSQGLTSTTNTTVTGTTTAIHTSYTTTVTGTTSVTATQYTTVSTTTQKSATQTLTSYVATAYTTSTVPTYVTVTSYAFGTETGTFQIPGYSPASVGTGVALGALALILGSIVRLGVKRGVKKSQLFAVILILSALFFGFFSQPSNAAAFTEWSLPSGSSIPYGIAFDDQSPYRVWFTEFGSDKIGRLNHLTGEIWEVKVRPDARPWGIDFENARHEVWFTMSGQDRVGVIEGYGGGGVKEINLGIGSGGPRGIAIQEHVNGTDFPYIWLAHYEGHTIVKLDPYDKERMTSWDLGGDVNPKAIIFVKDTGVWFTDVGASKRIGNLNPLTGEVKYWNLPAGSGAPEGLAADSNGFIWFTEDGVNHVSRLNPYLGELIRYRMPSVSSQPYGIAFDSLNHAWIADHGLNRITRFSPGDLTFTEFQRTTGGLPWGVAVSQEGWIWFTDESGNKIGRIDKDANKLSITTTSISTVSKTTETIVPASEIKNAVQDSPATADAATTVTYAPTTVTTTYGLTETVWLLQTQYTQTVTSYSTSSLFALGDTTTYQPTTVGTVTSSSTGTITQTVTTLSETVAGTTTIIYTVQSTSTVVTTIPFNVGAIPGFGAETMIVGLFIGILALIVFRRVKKR